ncbi:helix-turn-helix transcriptional regulator [Pseudoalteromonas sp. JBTF-M23]|uniref:Helix-turn-helix transcriptional regulator n=1 Tax=Pseudoalteromonas caenipelagi TaxID=2726988 RepID=A0A849VFY7_9GAMM|nr:helix-turn-helix transcriptional regulator [Pseudoalteromonas caenipelagi]NOU51710.1 helix-turn-helix transcriptional regulator [Pseudoalteromonas caenipelagi]
MTQDEVLAVFGSNVQKERQSKEFSQETLAEMAELDRTYISSMERGKRNVSLVNIVKISNALSISPSKLFEGIREIDG